jgi:hypothetical protein
MRLELPILKLSTQRSVQARNPAPIPDVFAVTLPIGTIVELAGQFRPRSAVQNPESGLVPFFAEQY